MLLFCCVPGAAGEEFSAREGLSPPGGVQLFTTLAAARSSCDDTLVVVNAEALGDDAPPAGRGGRVGFVPPEALCNVDPYRPPRPVTAAGGCVVRRADGGALDVLLIHRRGVWDLPKGKREADETVEECALREVREEVGVRALHLLNPLGGTVHGYERGGAFCVKTTHWFLMHTPATAFTPQAEENIDRVAWHAWSEAQRVLGYETLRRHLAGFDPDALAEHL